MAYTKLSLKEIVQAGDLVGRLARPGGNWCYAWHGARRVFGRRENVDACHFANKGILGDVH